MRCEESISCPRYLLAADTYTYYLLEYVSGGSYKQFPGVSCVCNFKMPVEAKHEYRWDYKQEAIHYFANQIILGINPPRDDTILIPMPTSKPRRHPEFDSRLDDVVNIIYHTTGQQIGFNFDVKQDALAYHNSGAPRNPAAIMDNIYFTPFQTRPPLNIVLIDDVVTTGAHFLACERILKQAEPSATVTGLFLAKTTWMQNA